MKYSCLIGDPVEHSTSPLLYDFFAKQFGVEYAHIKVQVPDGKKGSLSAAIQALRSMNFIGANVTLPYKQEVIRYLDVLTPKAKKIGAVNTIVNTKGVLIGYNTDGMGARKAIEFKYGEITSHDKVVIFGAGGVARAVAWEMLQKTRHVDIVNATSDFYLATSLQRDFKKAQRYPSIGHLTSSIITSSIAKSTIIINATPVGMSPRSNNSLVPNYIWSKLTKDCALGKKIFFDVVFNPVHTVFLKKAQQSGAKICSGMDMMVFQGAEAFRLWTGHRPSANLITAVIKFMYTTIR